MFWQTKEKRTHSIQEYKVKDEMEHSSSDNVKGDRWKEKEFGMKVVQMVWDIWDKPHIIQ